MLDFPTGTVDMACFPESDVQPGLNGALIYQPREVITPSDVMVYLDSRLTSLDQELARVEKRRWGNYYPKNFVSESNWVYGHFYRFRRK